MIDLINLKVCSGSGGSGSLSFRREKYVPFGGPDGGTGGGGGAVYIRADDALSDLSYLKGKTLLRAGAGWPGAGSNKQGGTGTSLSVEVPVGTQVSIPDLGDAKEWDLLTAGSFIPVVGGGEGGRGNRSFATPEVQVPRLAEAGALGECRDIVLNYKMISDFAILGSPNSGKSSLLNKLASVGTRVADYPMTTVEPVSGIFEKDWTQHSVVEIPSLWFSGAEARSKRSKLDTLKHSERALVLLICLDTTSQTLDHDYEQVLAGLKRYGFGLPEKPRTVLLNKVDSLIDMKAPLILKQELAESGVSYHFISAKTGEGVDEALSNAISITDRNGEAHQHPENPPPPELKPRPRGSKVEVKRSGKEFVVSCEHVERVIKGTDISEWEARVQLMSYISRAGVNKALEKAGAKTGDSVRIGEMEFELQ